MQRHDPARSEDHLRSTSHSIQERSMPAYRTSLLVLLAFTTACAQTDDDAVPSTAADSAANGSAAAITSIADVGLQTPESVLYDELADIYIVANVNGAPLDRD